MFESKENMEKSSIVNFIINGKPPRKHNNKSVWSNPTEIPRIVQLREKALEARKNAGFDSYFNCPVRLDLTVFAPNIVDRDRKQTGNDDPNAYVGDLDTFVAGVCESLKPNLELKPDFIFPGKDDISPNKPINIKDDSLIVSIIAKKVEDGDIHYSVVVEPA